MIYPIKAPWPPSRHWVAKRPSAQAPKRRVARGIWHQFGITTRPGAAETESVGPGISQRAQKHVGNGQIISLFKWILMRCFDVCICLCVYIYICIHTANN